MPWLCITSTPLAKARAAIRRRKTHCCYLLICLCFAFNVATATSHLQQLYSHLTSDWKQQSRHSMGVFTSCSFQPRLRTTRRSTIRTPTKQIKFLFWERRIYKDIAECSMGYTPIYIRKSRRHQWPIECKNYSKQVERDNDKYQITPAEIDRVLQRAREWKNNKEFQRTI